MPKEKALKTNKSGWADRFDKLIKETQKEFKKKKISRKDIVQAIQEVRAKQRGTKNESYNSR
ncbi:MAG: hypothetical protein COY75_02075 [Nitrospirae bacterium CG_4_10_14_0_8_um_filter_41_23]|uniref:Uncharacterized protein n=1 Tax=Candidatus Saganbacteria bacterium CG08_land_8_20_14_0_20_45_16 TaxID=2014293 RepID=A0A2H0XTB2_UNCSA|nr:MAG: hypothetical protein COT42_08810 [Candidatus Saganbacteria bacterium CG08_land_8_20_14_0_20_45_16]PIY87563.1 MAG: hypothetical protein COY75_02075 [Nitrospirae bacterium CG_4_10_14_0_8_um_filter_41_23]